MILCSEPFLKVDVGTGPCGNGIPNSSDPESMCSLAVAQRRNLSGMVAALDVAAGNGAVCIKTAELSSRMPNSLFKMMDSVSQMVKFVLQMMNLQSPRH